MLAVSTRTHAHIRTSSSIELYSEESRSIFIGLPVLRLRLICHLFLLLHVRETSLDSIDHHHHHLDSVLSFSFISSLVHGDDEHDGDLIHLFKIGLVHTSNYRLLTTMHRTSSSALMLTVAVVVVTVLSSTRRSMAARASTSVATTTHSDDDFNDDIELTSDM